jgi:hypothetical protein
LENSNSDLEESQQLKKKQKTSEEPVNDNITVYLNVHDDHLAPARGRRGTGKPVIAKCGPFFLDVNSHSYATFLQLIGSTAPCAVRDIVTAKMLQKFDKPDKCDSNALTNETGYQAMILSIQEKKKACVICIFMPPPMKPIDVVVCFESASI